MRVCELVEGRDFELVKFENSVKKKKRKLMVIDVYYLRMIGYTLKVEKQDRGVAGSEKKC